MYNPDLHASKEEISSKSQPYTTRNELDRVEGQQATIILGY